LISQCPATVALIVKKGLSSEMEGGMKRLSVDKSPFKQWTAQYNLVF